MHPGKGGRVKMKYSYEQKCELLDERASLQGFFDILCADEGGTGSILAGGR